MRHMIPSLPRAICGVGDYATTVDLRMQYLQPGTRCRYPVVQYRDDGGAPRKQTPEWFWDHVERHFKPDSLAQLGKVFHFSPYGCSSDGAHCWLADTITNGPAWAEDLRLS